jgi:hypothetical protein
MAAVIFLFNRGYPTFSDAILARYAFYVSIHINAS